MRFPVVKKIKNRLRFDKVTESLKVGTFLRHSVVYFFVLLNSTNTSVEQQNH